MMPYLGAQGDVSSFLNFSLNGILDASPEMFFKALLLIRLQKLPQAADFMERIMSSIFSG